VLKNYIVTALRNIRKNKLTSVITVVGFSIGIACALFIFLFVQNELSFNSFLDAHERIHRVLLEATTMQGGEFVTANVNRKIKNTLAADTNTVAALTQLMESDGIFGWNNRYFYEADGVYTTDASFLKVFSYPLAAGDRSTALEKPMSLLLTRRTAGRWFGTANPIGQTVSFKNSLLGDMEYSFTVTGVLEDLPPNSSFAFDVVVNCPFDKLLTDAIAHYTRAYGVTARPEYINLQVQTFVLLKSSFLLPAFGKILRDASFSIPNYDLALTFKNIRLSSEALDALYLFPRVDNPQEKKGSFLFLLLLAGLGVVVIVIACINVINLTTARALTRVKEIGIRKSLGASRRELMVQYLTESVLLSFISLMFALVIVELCLPLFNALVDRHLAVGYLTNPLYPAAVIVSTFGIGLLSGLYPALYLSSFNTVNIQRRLKTPGSRRVREAMVVVQFVFSIGLFIASAVILREFQAIKKIDTGIDSRNTLMARLNFPEPENKIPDLKKALGALNGVAGVTASSAAGWEFGEIIRDFPLAISTQRLYFDLMVVDPDYLRVRGLALAAGRNFDPDYNNPYALELVINEAARRLYGFTVNTIVADRGFMGKVVGVVKDFDYVFPARAVRPLLLITRSPFLINTSYAPKPVHLDYLLVKLRPDAPQTTLSEIEALWKAMIPGYSFEYRYEEREIARQLDEANRSFESVLSVSTVLAFLLSGLGLFGLAFFEIERRTKEVGIRKALGATQAQIVLHFLKGFFKLIGAANLIAWPLTFVLIQGVFALMQYPRPLVIGPLIFLEVGLLSAGLTLVTVGVQTLRAASANPVNTLRYE
jgi:putative ABC transport system permease protein